MRGTRPSNRVRPEAVTVLPVREDREPEVNATESGEHGPSVSDRDHETRRGSNR